MGIVTADKAEWLILEYLVLRWKYLNGELGKLERALEEKATAINISLRTAWRVVQFGRSIGAIDCGKIRES